MELRLLGGLEISQDGVPVTGFVSSKAPALVAYLAATGGSHTRDALAGLLWSDVPDKDARASLRVVLSNLRQTLGPERFSIDRTHVALAPDAALASDLGEFLEAAVSSDPDSLNRACELYEGDFLAGFAVRDAPSFEEWVVTERERIRAQALTTYERLAEHQAGIEAHDLAANTLERLLEIEPWHEAAFRRYMEQLALAGRRNSALVQFDAFSRLLEQELGVEPEPETVDLFKRVRDGAYAATSAVEPTDTAPRRIQAPPSRRRPRGPATSFVGRDEELALLAEYLHDSSIRLISLVGPGGSGKTRLALQAAGEHGHDYDLGSRVALLADVDDTDQLPFTIAQALGLSLSGTGDPFPEMQHQLSDATALLVLDNFEHLLDATGIVSDLLDMVPGITILVTSRERLALQAEWTIPVEGLRLSDDDPIHSSAVQLFIDRARQVQADFLPGDDELHHITDICRQVEGSPLGIELAASWIRMMGCAEIARQIRASHDFLSTTLRDVPARHRSLRAAFNGSWDMLDQADQQKYSILAVFSGGFTARAAHIIGGAALPDLLDFVDKSLVRRDSTGRFRLHEVLRQYAAERLEGDPDAAAAAKDRHAGYYSDLMARSEPRLKGAQQAETLQEIDAERSNLRLAWEWMVRHRQYERIGAALNGTGLFFSLQHLLAPGRQLMDIAETALRAVQDECAEAEILLGRVLGRQARITLTLGQPESAEAQIQEAQSLLARHQALDQLAYGLDIQGRIASLRGDFREAYRLHQMALEEAQETGDRYAESNALNRLGGLAFNTGDFRTARDRFSRSLETRRANQDWEGVARELGNLAEVDCETGDYERALSYLDESRAVHRELGIERLPSRLEGRGRIALRRGDLDEAERCLGEAEQLALDQGGTVIGAIALMRQAELALLRNDLEGVKPLLARARDRFEAHEFRPGIAEWGIVRSRLALFEHRPEEALHSADEALALTEDLGNIVGSALAIGASARAMLALGQIDEAFMALRDAVQLARGSGATPALLDLATALVHARLAAITAGDGARDSEATLAELAAYLTFIQDQPQTWHSTRLESQALLDNILQLLDSAQPERVGQRPGTLSIERVLTDLAGPQLNF